MKVTLTLPCCFCVGKDEMCQKPATMSLPYEGEPVTLCDYHAGCIAVAITDEDENKGSESGVSR